MRGCGGLRGLRGGKGQRSRPLWGQRSPALPFRPSGCRAAHPAPRHVAASGLQATPTARRRPMGGREREELFRPLPCHWPIGGRWREGPRPAPSRSLANGRRRANPGHAPSLSLANGRKGRGGGEGGHAPSLSIANGRLCRSGPTAPHPSHCTPQRNPPPKKTDTRTAWEPPLLLHSPPK